MIRFIPTFYNDLKQINEALRIRGYRVSWKQFLLHPALSMRFVTTPLLYRSLKSSEELGIAAELKGLGAGRRMRPFRSPAWKRADTCLLAGAVLAVAGAALCAFLLPVETRAMGGMP